MAFETFEESRYAGEPITLFKFVGSVSELDSNVKEVFAFTDAEEPVVKDGQTYTPWPIEHEAIKASGNAERSTLKVTLALGSDLDDFFISYPPSAKIVLTIHQGHVGEAEYKLLWTGIAESPAYGTNEISITCRSTRASMGRAGLHRNYQRSCNLPLYSTRCGASKAAATVTMLASGVAGQVVTLGGTLANHEKYLGGMIQWRRGAGFTEYRTITAATATTVTLRGLLRELGVGTSVDLVLGCGHGRDDCQTVHNNILNFGGQAWIPLENPLSTKNQFY